MGTENNNMEGRSSPEYLAQLLKDKKQIQAFPNVFQHLERLLDEEINKVRGNLFHFATNKEPLALPEASGPVVTLSEKLYVPAKEHPDFNFVGRILGPRGMTAKQLEQETGCKIMVRGKGSMRDKQKEEMNRGKPNWEHLNEELHVLITVEDHRQRGEVKLVRAVNEVKKLLVPAPEGEDELKKLQLMELAIMNGTFRDNKQLISMQLGSFPDYQRMAAAAAGMPTLNAAASGMLGLRSPGPQGAPILLTGPRLQQASPHHHHHQMHHPQVSLASLMNGGATSGGPPPLVSPTDGMIYQYDPYSAMTAGAPLLEYPGLEQSGAGTSHTSPFVR